jgi:hypothetical protein
LADEVGGAGCDVAYASDGTDDRGGDGGDGTAC